MIVLERWTGGQVDELSKVYKRKGVMMNTNGFYISRAPIYAVRSIYGYLFIWVLFGHESLTRMCVCLMMRFLWTLSLYSFPLSFESVHKVFKKEEEKANEKNRNLKSENKQSGLKIHWYKIIKCNTHNNSNAKFAKTNNNNNIHSLIHWTVCKYNFKFILYVVVWWTWFINFIIIILHWIAYWIQWKTMTEGGRNGSLAYSYYYILLTLCDK